jgi:hypothetical protein
LAAEPPDSQSPRAAPGGPLRNAHTPLQIRSAVKVLREQWDNFNYKAHIPELPDVDARREVEKRSKLLQLL